MSGIVTISSLLSVPTLAVDGRLQLTVGMQLSDGQQFWADCIDTSAASREGETAAFDPIQAAEHVQNLVQPLWLNQPATQFRRLAQKLLPLVAPFRYRKTQPKKPEPSTGAISRRSLITGLLAGEDPDAAPVAEDVVVQRPLHPALQFGLTAALLQASAGASRLSVVAFVAQEYGLPQPKTAVPLQIPLNDQYLQTAHSILTTHVTSFGYTTSKNNHKAVLGKNGKRLQQHVRQIAAWLPSLDAAYRPILHLDLQGGYGKLFENNPGKILGALFGLELAAKPYQLQIQNPILQESRDEQVEQLTQLTNLVKMRRLSLQLVADAWVDSPTDVAQFANPQVCQMVHLDLPRLGNLEMGITAVLQCLGQNHPLILSGTDDPLTTQIALAVQPTLLHGAPLPHYNEMQKTLAR